MKREGFIFYQSFRNGTKHLPKDNQKNCLMMIVKYGIEGVPPKPEEDEIAFGMFLMAKPQIDKNNTRFLSGKNGGRPPLTKDKPKDNQKITKGKANVKEKDNVKDKEIPCPKIDDFWSTFPHARKGKKEEVKKILKTLNWEDVEKEIKLLKWKITFGLQDGSFVPAAERWIRDFTKVSDSVRNQDIKKMTYRLMEIPAEKRKDTAIGFINDFGKETVDAFVKERNKEKNGITLKFKDDSGKVTTTNF